MNIPSIGVSCPTGDSIADFVAGIDHPVDEVIVVFDGCKKIELPSNPMVGKTVPVALPGRIGHAACWNLIVKSRMKSPHWILAVEGVDPKGGSLSEFSSIIARDPSPGIVHASSGDFAAGCWDLFMVSDDIIGIMGLFDENLDDWEFVGADYLMRTAHRPIKKITSLGREYLNAPAHYEESTAIRQHDYLTSKWGEWKACSPHFHPFSNEDFAVGYFPNTMRQ